MVEETGSMCDREAMACVGCQLLFIPCDLSHLHYLRGFPFTGCVRCLLKEGRTAYYHLRLPLLLFSCFVFEFVILLYFLTL